MKLNDYSDAELGAIFRDRFERLAQAHGAGITDTHPRDQWNADNATLRDYRDAAAAGGTTQRIEPMPPRNAKPAQDSALAEHYIRSSGHTDIAGQLALHGARQTNPARAARMAAAIPGYGRLALKK